MLGRLLLCLFCCIPLLVAGQETYERCRWLKPSAGSPAAGSPAAGTPAASPQQLDSLSVLPSSIRINGIDREDAFVYDPNSGTLRFKEGEWPDSVEVCYKALPYALHKAYFNRSLAVYDSNALYEYPLKTKPEPGLREELFASDSLQKSGSISRGISFGNTQNVFVQSALNLQLDGKLSDRINIRAAISDQNVPFQPEGNTQYLQEFDKVYIQLYDDNSSLTAGDIVLQQHQESHFLKYLKNVQGLQFSTSYPLLGRGRSQTEAGIALAKGRFASVNLEAVDGLSGPYKLPGPAGQSFVMVLSNSERVFLDGRLLQRGFNYDYTIDYNLGEITFNPGLVITRYSRIRVDYEYSDRSYSRSILQASHRQQMGKLQVYSHFYQEKDNRNQPLGEQLSQEQMLQLSLAGDSPEGIYVEAVDSVGYNADLLLYRKVSEQSASGAQLVYYEFSTDPQEARYRLSFADLGQGRGNYVFQEYIGTGKVYAYVPPLNGQPQGRYEPVRMLNPPVRKNMLASGARLQLGRYQQFYTEMALSSHDQNLFSEMDAADNKGVGIKGGYALRDLPARFDSTYRWEAGIDYEFVHKNFSPVDRFRSIEFDRDWGLSSGFGNTFTDTYNDPFFDNLLTFSGGLQKDTRNRIHYRISGRQKGELVNGWQQEAELAKRMGILQLNGRHFYLHNQQKVQDIYWRRWQGETALHFNKLVPGYMYTSDRQATQSLAGDSVLSSLMNFDEHRLYLQSGEGIRNNMRAEYSLREDFAPVNGSFQRANYAHLASFSYAGELSATQKIRTLTSYRHSTNYQVSEEPQVENTLTGQFNWLGSFWQKMIRSELIYTVGSGRELQRDYVYVRVPTGEGTHTWRDDNDNGVQELNEFYEAINPDEKEFLRIFVPTTDFMLAYTSELNYRLNYQGKKEWSQEGGLKKVLGQLSGNASWRSAKKSTAEELMARFLPFTDNITENELLHSRQSVQLNLFYNRNNPRWGFDGNFIQQERKQLLSAGFETDQRKRYTLGYRYNIGREWGFRFKLGQGSEANLSDYLRNQQYRISLYELAPEISWMPLMDFQASLGSTFRQKENSLNPELTRAAKLADINLNLRYSRLSGTSLSSTIRQVRIELDGRENTPAAYSMLEALRPGTNWVWNVNLQQRLLKGLQLSLTYEGRKAEGQPVVQLGRMMVQALF